MRHRCIPQLYRKVDLSSHNLGRFPENEDKFRPEAWASTDDTNHPDNLLSRQRAFLRTMIQHTEYSTYIRYFSWTLIWYDQYVPDGADGDILPEIDCQLWNVFSRLKNVEILDLAPYALDKSLEAYTRQIPAVLFPLVIELHLGGWMTHELVATIFKSIKLPKLRILNLNALQEEGKLLDGSPMPEYINITSWDDGRRTKLCQNYTTTTNNFEILFPGPMWTALLPLVGRLDSLQQLGIQIPPFEEARQNDDCPEYERYISVMAHLLISVAATLRELIVDYARQRRFGNFGHSGAGYAVISLGPAARFRRCEKILNSIMSTLLSSELEWESLCSVSLKSFGQQNDLAERLPTPGETIQALRSQIGNYMSSRKVLFQWSDDSPRPAFLYLGHDFGVSDTELEQFNRAIEKQEHA